MGEAERPIVTPGRLVADLRALGLRAGDTIELHASVGTIGTVVGGPTTVLRSLFEVVGPEGTVMMLASWDDSPYEMDEWSEQRQRAYLEEARAFDAATSPAYRGWSILVEHLRTWPGAHRSGNPDRSFTAAGAKAEWLMADHPLQYGYGEGSPLAKLYEAGGRVLLLGAPLNTITSLHYAEHRARVPDKRTVRYKMPILRDGERVWVDIEELDSSTGIVDWAGGDYFPAIAQAYLDSGHGLTGQVGGARSYLFDQHELVDFAVEWMERELTKPDATGTIAVRQATAKDIDGILALQQRWSDEGITFGYEPNNREFVEGRIGPLSFVAELNERLIGFAYGALHTSDGQAVTRAGERYLEVDDLYMAPEFRNMNVGSRLLETLIEAARSQGITRVQAFSATKDHNAILRFYREHGFRPWGVQLYREG